MAANQELKNYIVEQTKLGVSKDAVKSALLEAGWKEDDVNQAIAEAQPASQGAAAASFKPVSPVQQTQPFQPAKPAEVLQTSKPVNMSGLSSPVTKDSPVSFVTSDIFKSRGEPVFQPSGMKSQASSNSPEAKPQVISMAPNNKSGEGRGRKIFSISLGVLSIILLGGNVYFFLQNRDLSSKIGALSGVSASTENQVASLTADKKNLTDQINSINKTLADLNSQISIFAASATGSTSTVSFEISGTLGGGGKSLYSVTTSKNVVLLIKNSKDTDVDTVLKSLIGTQVGIGGTHQPESNQLTVITINGQPVLGAAKAAAAAASSTQSSGQTSTSTGKAATSTP